MLQRRKLASLLVLAGIVSAGPAFGQSGSFTFVTGDVSVQRRDGQRVPVTRGAPVNAGDTIVSGDKGMAQLTMVDQAKISLRPNTQFQIEQYADRPDSDQGALLNLVRGTLRTFTGLIAARTRDRFLMKTRVATVGIRGSGNVLFAGTADDCDPSKVGAGTGTGCDITVNHTIEGSHAITFGDFSGPGLPPQQGGAQMLVTGPGQTVLVTSRGDVRYIPTPQFIAAAATNPTGADKGGGGGESGGSTRNFAPSDSSGSVTSQGTATVTPVGNNGLGFSFADVATATDPLGLQDIVIAGGATLVGQALPGDIVYEGTAMRGYSAYSGTLTGLEPLIIGGTSRSNSSFQGGGLTMSAGRYEDARLRFFDTDPSFAVPGSIHWIQANSGYPVYLTDVLTGTATYTSVLSSPPTSQTNRVGILGPATVDVNFTNRTLSTSMSVTMPAAGGSAGGTWQVSASGVPFALNSFFATTSDLLVVRSATGASSTNNPNVAGGIDGSFVGSDLSGLIMGYTISDYSSSNPANFYSINGVVGFQGPAQDITASYRDGVVSDPLGALAGGLVRNYAVTNRPAEVTADAQGRVTTFTAPYNGEMGGHQQYSVGTASVADFGRDATTGLVWGRWSGGSASVIANGNVNALPLNGRSLHYVFSDVQNAPVTMPLTGTASYELVGSTLPTNSSGGVGTLNSATLAADFATRTVDTSVNVTVGGQNIVGVANDVPIFRDQYFSAFRGNAPGGLPVPQLLNITCNPACSNPTGSIDGFFAGRGAAGAGMMYNLNGATGAAAFRRPGT